MADNSIEKELRLVDNFIWIEAVAAPKTVCAMEGGRSAAYFGL